MFLLLLLSNMYDEKFVEKLAHAFDKIDYDVDDINKDVKSLKDVIDDILIVMNDLKRENVQLKKQLNEFDKKIEKINNYLKEKSKEQEIKEMRDKNIPVYPWEDEIDGWRY